ncbi:DEAD/DEAH box helicase family protein [Shewanella sp. UCD-KL12]|uniref:DEAD/DEAH box helicase family protein n=1 Tax=Shewanella sp. UCD-KL12 TaxID=1917163 RepID=UPI0015C3DDDC|nr:DEAD/DEAH box helicase family protein [Shewanella sp. UCD-KL12]
MSETAGAKNGSFAVGSDKEIYQLQADSWVSTDFSGKAKERLTGLCGLRHSLMSLLNAEQTNIDETLMEEIRKQLNERYDLFTTKYGFISDSANQRVCKLDPTNYNLLSLERDYSAGVTPTQAKKLGVSAVKPSCGKAEIFTQRVMIPWVAPKSAENIQDALLASLNVHGRVDLNYCAELLGTPVNSLVAQSEGELIFNDHGNWVTKNVFQSGDIKTKVSQLETCGYTDQLKSQYQSALNEALPLDVQFEDIQVGLGAAWVPASVYEEFINTLCDGKINSYTKIEIMYLNNEWHLNLSCLPHSLETSLGDNNYPFSKLIKRLMNGRGTEVLVTDPNGKRVIDKESSLNNELNSGLIASEWDNFLENNINVQNQLCQIFNEKFNRYSPLKALDNMMLLPDSNQSIQLREHQLKAVYRGVTEGRLLLNHVVGAGKSYTIAAIAHELVRLGLKKRCVIVVPNHLTSQFAGQYLTLYPADQITVLSPDELSPKVRQASLLRLKTGSSIVICPESSFASISPDCDVEKSVIESEICKLDQALSDVDQSGKRFTVKNIENRKANLESRLLELANDHRKKELSISDLGIDALFCDEAHSLKNLAYDSTRLTNVKGTNTPTGSKRAFDWYLKVKSLRASNSKGNGLGVYLSTGTPIANSLLEVFTFSRYLAEDEVLENSGINHIDTWVSAFADIKSDFEISATGSGTFKPVTRLRAFKNLSQLKSQWSLFTDSVTAKELLGYLPKLEKVDGNTTQYFDAIPRITGGKAQQIIVEPTELQLDFAKSLVERASNFKSSKVANDNMLLVMNHARKSSIDMRLLNPNLPPEVSGNKIPATAKVVAKKYHETTSIRGTQIIFLDLGVENKDGRHSVYSDLKKQLRSLGVQESEIAFAQSYKTPIAKSELYSKLNQGIIRVVIASTNPSW